MSIKDIFKKHKFKFFLYIVGVLLTTPTNLFVTFSMGNAFKILDDEKVMPIIVVSIILAVLPSLFQLVSRYLRVGFMNDVLLDVRLLSYEKILATPIYQFKEESIENYQSRLTSDINLFETDFFLSILNIAYSIGSYVLGILVINWISPILSILVITSSIVFYILSKAFEKSSKTASEKVMKQNKKFHQMISNLVRGLETIKLYNVESFFINQSRFEVEKLETVKKEKTHLENLQSEIFMALAFIFQMASFIISAVLLSKGKIKISQLVIAINLVGQLSWAITNMFVFLNRYKASVKIFNSLTLIDSINKPNDLFSFEKGLEVKNLDFSYGKKQVIDNLSFSLKPKEKLLITGPSGTGKTSLLELIVGNLKLQSGSISYDGISIENINVNDLWSKVSYARQNHFMFDDSIVNNIILNHEYSKMRFERIMEGLDLLDWIESLKDKENTMLFDNAANISGGQRQRLSIARALYQDSDLYIFDEPSASLDDETAYKVYSFLSELDASVIFVSHRHLEYLENSYMHRLDLKITRSPYEKI